MQIFHSLNTEDISHLNKQRLFDLRSNVITAKRNFLYQSNATTNILHLNDSLMILRLQINNKFD